MPLYSDSKHLIADTIAELVEYGRAAGIPDCLLKDKYPDEPSQKLYKPHYRLVGKMRERIVNDQSVEICPTRMIVKKLREFYGLPETDEDWERWQEKNGKLKSISPEAFSRIWAEVHKSLNKNQK